MSAFENVVVGKLKLKGKALDVKAGGLKKKKKNYDQIFQASENLLSAGGNTGKPTDLDKNDMSDANESMGEGNAARADYYVHLTPAERRYMERRRELMFTAGQDG